MQLQKSDKTIANQLALQRGKEQSSFFSRSQARRLRAIQLSDKPMLGRDKNGTSVETLRPEAFRILLDKWHVRLVFGKDDSKEMAGSSISEAEARLKAGEVSRKEVRITTHIIRAVRLLSHIDKSYANEIAETKRVLSRLDSLNVALTRKDSHSSEELNSAISFLEEFGKGTLARKHTAVKRIIAQERLTQTVEMLKSALEMPIGRERDFQVWAACAKFTSLRNRLGQWRGSDISWRVEYNDMKACSLRVIRDAWIFSRLVAFAADPEKISGYVERDREKLAVLGKIRAMLSSNIQIGAILRYMESVHPLFRVAERERFGAEEAVSNAEGKDELPKDGKKYDYQIGHYAWLYRHIKSGDRAKAIDKIADLELFVHANKPRFILDELQKGHENYLNGTVAALAAAVLAFEAKDFKSAQDGFISSAELLRETFEPFLKA